MQYDKGGGVEIEGDAVTVIGTCNENKRGAREPASR